jgi:hypothetical protein
MDFFHKVGNKIDLTHKNNLLTYLVGTYFPT